MVAETFPLRIVADDREPEVILAALRALPGVRLLVTRLELGDFLVEDDILVERKTLADFALSVIDGRLFGQASRLAECSKRAVVILEGGAACLAKTGLRREALQGALITLSLIFGIPVLRSACPEETGRLILYSAKQRRAFATGALRRPGFRPKGKRRRQMYILQGLPDVGPKRARRLLTAFGSVEAVLQAEVASLMSVPGIGRKTAEAIRWSVSEAEPVYIL